MMKWITIHLNSVCIRQGYLKNSAAMLHCKYSLRNHIYPVLEDVQLNDATTFANGNSLSVAANGEEEKAKHHNSLVFTFVEEVRR